MTIDLKSMTRKELEKLKTSVERELARTIERDKKAAVAAAQKAAREHGFELTDVVDTKKPIKKTKAKKKLKPAAGSPKYRHPEKS